MGKRLSLEDKAKIANGNERHCRQCNHRVCPDGLLEVCSEAFIRGYKKGYKQSQKEQIAWCYPKDLIKLLGYDKKYADFERIALSEGAFSYPREEYEENLQKYSAVRYEHKKYYHYRKLKK